jgi:hypothetical protein
MKNKIALFSFYVESEWYGGGGGKTEYSVIHTEIRKLCVLLSVLYINLRKELPMF